MGGTGRQPGAGLEWFPLPVGSSIAKLGDWRFVDQSLPPIIARLEADPDYPFDFLYAQSTHPIRVDNGPPDSRMPDFVRDWNAEGRTPRLAFTTPAALNRLLRDRYADRLVTRRGDWLDWWADGVASSAYETGVSRATHEQLLMAELVDGWLQSAGRRPPWSADRAAHAYEQATLYDEHTWGAFASIAAPQSLWTKTQWNRKANYGYTASAEALDLLARGVAGARRERRRTGDRGDVQPRRSRSPSGLPGDRRRLAAGDQHAAVAAPGGGRGTRAAGLGGAGRRAWSRSSRAMCPGVATDRKRRCAGWPARCRVSATLSCRYRSQPAEDDLAVGPNTIENAHYRVRLDPATGAVAEWYDKELGHDFAGSYQGWGIGQYVYERVDSPEDRQALFWGDFSMDDFGYGRTDTPWQRSTVSTVAVGEPRIAHGRATIAVDVTAPGIRCGRCMFALESRTRSLAIDWLLDKEHQTGIEAVFVAFPFNLGAPRFRADVNGVPFTPEADQLHGTVRDWYPLGRWVDVSDGERGVTLTPLDAPLVHLGGITTGKWARTLEPEGPTLMSWALQNHWMVNFKASQGGEIPLRYRLTTHAGPCDDAAAARFGAESATPPIVAPRLPADRAGDRSLRRGAGRRAGPGHRQAGRGRRRRDLRVQNLTTEPRSSRSASTRQHRPRRR